MSFNEKLLKTVEKKLTEEQVIIQVLSVSVFRKGDRSSDENLVVTNKVLLFYHNTSLKKSLPVADITFVTVAIFSNQAILHSAQDDIRIQSRHLVKLVKDILLVRTKMLSRPTLEVRIELEAKLQAYTDRLPARQSLWNYIFTRKHEQRGRTQSEHLQSFSVLQVTSKNFMLQIGKEMYAKAYTGLTLLYVSGEEGFMLKKKEYVKELVSEVEVIYKHTERNERMKVSIVHKNSVEQANRMRQALIDFKIADYNEQLLYAFESDSYFELVTALPESLSSMEQLLSEEKFVSEVSLISLFYKLMSFSNGNSDVLCSLCPKRILLAGEDITISSIMCAVQGETQMDYLAPEELAIGEVSNRLEDRELINFWKIGVLIYEIAYCCLPFPVEYVAECAAYKCKFFLRFPDRSARSRELELFLMLLLKLDPLQRGGGANWKREIFEHAWIRKQSSSRVHTEPNSL